ncbi:MAG: Gfo/Idh/MocA family oxidoreductase [Candidatus Poribacteria bacterium]|nr:Gfo/Idh/MocA family oxidoreductase [Candidatus Poribacteria bacterium]
MSNDTIRVGFIGTGGNARGHIRQTAKVEGVEIVGFADPAEAALKNALEGLGKTVPTFADYKEFLNTVEMDAVIISTPHTLHYEQVMTALNHDLHVQIEKPMACTSAHAREIMAKQQATGKVVLIGYQRHFDRRFRWIKREIEKGVFGRITFLECFQSQNWLRGQQGRWRLDPALSGGGQFNDSGSHLVDIILWITGLAAEEVTAYVDNRGERVDINSAVSVRFTNGAVGNISILGDQVANGMWEDITIAGEKGVAWMRQGGKLHYATEDSLDITEVTDFSDVETYDGGKDQHFFDIIRGKVENQVPPICGLRVIELTEAVWRAAESGKPTKVETA